MQFLDHRLDPGIHQPFQAKFAGLLQFVQQLRAARSNPGNMLVDNGLQQALAVAEMILAGIGIALP